MKCNIGKIDKFTVKIYKKYLKYIFNLYILNQIFFVDLINIDINDKISYYYVYINIKSYNFVKKERSKKKMELISRNSIIFNIEAKTKEDVIKILANRLNENGNIKNLDAFYQDVLDREKLSPTYIGFDIGIPHGRTDNILSPAICFGKLKEPVLWNDSENEFAKLVILIAVPSSDKDNTHMKIISKLAREIMHEHFRTILLSGKEEEVYNTLLKLTNE